MRNGAYGVLLSVADAADVFRVPAGTLRRWAHEDGWRQFGGPRSRHWLAEDVQDAFEKRRARQVDNEWRVPNSNP